MIRLEERLKKMVGYTWLAQWERMDAGRELYSFVSESNQIPTPTFLPM